MKKTKKASHHPPKRKEKAKSKRNKTCDECPSSFSTINGLAQHKKIHKKLEESNYKCDICDETFHDAEKFRKHMFEHDVKLYKCESCGASFKYLQSYMRHLRDYSEPHFFPCEKCGKVFKRFIFLQKHYCEFKNQNSVEPQESLTNSCKDNLQGNEIFHDLTCKECDWFFPSVFKLQQHLKIYSEKHFVFPCCGETLKQNFNFKNHICAENKSIPEIEDETEKNGTYKCDNCSATFFRFHSLKHHIKKYPGKHDFQCNDCKKRFPDVSALDKHLCLFKDNKSFKCSCLKSFTSMKKFKEHVGTHRPYFCCACRIKCITFSNLINHIRTHTKEKPYSCSFCDKSFTVKETLRLHLRNHSGIKPYKCSKCDYSSSAKWNLRLHEKRHNSDRKDDKKFLCTECGALFYMKHHLNRHAMTHTQEKTHLCKICGKLFSQSSYLNRHLENHNKYSKCPRCDFELKNNDAYQHHVDTGHFLFVCDPCEKVFLTDNNLQKHLKSHNKNERKLSCDVCGKMFVNKGNLKKHYIKHENVVS